MNDLPPPPLPVLPERERILPHIAVPLVLILAGCAALAFLAVREAAWLQDQPWGDALVVLNHETQEADAIPVWSRRIDVDPEQSDDLSQFFQAIEETEGLADLKDMMKPEHLFAVEMDTAEWSPLLASGRLPEAGKAEVLAGQLARFEEFNVAGQTFQVVGRLKSSASGFLFAYLLPYDAGLDPVFKTESERGFFFVDGIKRIDKLFPEDEIAAEEKPEEAEKPEPELVGGQVPATSSVVWATFASLVLIAVGGSILHIRLFAHWSIAAPEVFQSILRETVRFRGLFLGTHVMLYGAFFGAMLASMQLPLLNYWMTHYIGSVFREGGLSYIGDAYASRNILHATLATFYNNYVIQTLAMTFFPSVLPLALGFVKTALSFGTAGFVMAPVWAGTASGMVYHSITIILELEAYILAAFATLAWPIRLFRAAFQETPRTELMLALRTFIGAMVLSGVMLAIAALYEATTLILLRPGF